MDKFKIGSGSANPLLNSNALDPTEELSQGAKEVPKV